MKIEPPRTWKLQLAHLISQFVGFAFCCSAPQVNDRGGLLEHNIDNYNYNISSSSLSLSHSLPLSISLLRWAQGQDQPAGLPFGGI